MANREDLLNELTFKSDDFPVEQRVFYSLTAIDSLQADRTVKLLSHIVAILTKYGKISDTELDDLLLKVTM